MARTTCIRNLAWTIAWDAASARHVYLRGADIVLEGSTIAALGKGAAEPADETVDGSRLMAMPGLVDLHSHPTLELLYRGVREEHGVPAMYMTGLYERMQAFHVDEEGRRACAEASFAELLRSGVTTLVDISSDYEGWLDLFAQSGLRGYVAPYIASARHVMRVPHLIDYEWDEQAGRRSLAVAAERMDQADAHPCGRLAGMVSVSTIDAVTPQLLGESLELARSTDRPLTVHVAESVLEFKNMVDREGMTPIEWAEHRGVLGPRTILGHAIFTDEHPASNWHSREDVARLAASGATVAHCPTPFSRYGQTLHHFGRYVDAGVNMGIGTDTLPANMIEELRTASVLGRIAAKNVHATSLADVFHAATAGGASALGREDIGRLAPGAKADLVLVDLSHPQMRPVRDPLRSLVYSAADRAVRDVYVDGERVVENGAVLTLDVEDALERLQGAQERMIARVPEHDFRGRSAEEITPLSLELR